MCIIKFSRNKFQPKEKDKNQEIETFKTDDKTFDLPVLQCSYTLTYPSYIFTETCALNNITNDIISRKRYQSEFLCNYSIYSDVCFILYSLNFSLSAYMFCFDNIKRVYLLRFIF